MANFILKEGEKARNVWCILWMEDLERLYPDNPYGALLQYLEGLKIPCAVSPIHDNDVYSPEDVANWCRRHIDPDTGEVREDSVSLTPRVGDPKKAHVHLYIEYKNPVTRMYLSDEIMAEFIEIKHNRWERVIHPDTAKCYLCHKGYPDKYQYPATGIHSFGAIKMECLLRTDEFAKVNTFIAVQEYCIDNNIKHYHVLVRWAMGTGDYQVISCVIGRASHFAYYFRSISDEKREKAEKEAMAEKKALSAKNG